MGKPFSTTKDTTLAPDAHLPRTQVPWSAGEVTTLARGREASAGEVNMPEAEAIFPFVYLVPFVVRLFPVNSGRAKFL